MLVSGFVGLLFGAEQNKGYSGSLSARIGWIDFHQEVSTVSNPRSTASRKTTGTQFELKARQTVGELYYEAREDGHLTREAKKLQCGTGGWI